MSTPPSAEYFDQWYANLARSAPLAEIQLRTLGLPPAVESTSLLPWDGIAAIADELELHPGDTLVDLACGRGGYGLEVARRTGARLIGVDFSAVAIDRAREKADAPAEFHVGELVASGRPDASADAVMCVDAMQFADPYGAGLAECRRILRPGGRLVLTGWQAHDLADGLVPPRLRYDIAAELAAAGFTHVAVANQPSWRAAELAYWRAILAVDPGDDAGLRSLHAEAVRIEPVLERTDRVLVRAVAP